MGVSFKEVLFYPVLVFLLTVTTHIQEVNVSEEEAIYAAFMTKPRDKDKSCIQEIREALLERKTEIQSQIDEEGEIATCLDRISLVANV